MKRIRTKRTIERGNMKYHADNEFVIEDGLAAEWCADGSAELVQTFEPKTAEPEAPKPETEKPEIKKRRVPRKRVKRS